MVDVSRQVVERRLRYAEVLRQHLARRVREPIGDQERLVLGEVAVVEDEQDIRETLRDILEMEGYRVRCACNGKEALDALAEMPRPLLILLDLMMPVMSGTELAKRVKAIRPGLPVVLISGMNEIPQDASCADRFISKVDGPDVLFRTILEVLEGARQTN